MSVAVATNSSDQELLEVFVCFFCENEFAEKSKLQRHQRKCKRRPPELCSVPAQPRRSVCKRNWTYQYKAPQKRDFFEGLALVSKSKADVIRKRTDSKALDVDVEVIDLEDPTIDQTPPTPSKSPRPIFCRRESIIVKQETPDVDDRTDLNDSRSDAGGNDIKYHPRKSVSLLSIDVTSVLGQRVKKHVKLPGGNWGDMGEVFDDLPPYEKFCRTPVKNGIVRQLRHRDDGFPVTFRKSKRLLPLSTHLYTFTCRQRMENYRRLVTGLSARSRELKRSMRECRIVMQRMTATQIQRWTNRPASTLKVRLSPLTPDEIACWLTGEKGRSYMFPNTHGGSAPNGHVLRGLLGPNAAASPLSHRQRRLTLSPVASKGVNVELLRQKSLVFRSLLSEMGTGGGDGRNMIDLTGPASSKDGPTDGAARKGHDLRKEPPRKATFGDGLPVAPNENRRPKQSPEIRMSHTTESFYNSGKIVRNGRQAAALRTRPENAMAGDSALRQQLLLRGGDEPVVSASALPHSTRNTTNGNAVKASPTQTKRSLVWEGRTSGAPDATLNRRHSATATSVSSARRALSSPVDDVVVTISDDESTPADDVPIVRGHRRSSSIGRDGPVAKRRKSSQASSPDMLFNCHMCGDAITFNADMQTYITQHFATRHGVPNVRLVQKVGADGRKVVTIVEGPPPQPPMASGRSMNRPMANVPPQRRDLVNKITTQRTQPPPMTPAPTRRLTRLNSVPDIGMTTRAGTTVARPVRDRHSAPIVDYICID